MVRVDETAERSCEREGCQSIAHRIVLDLGDKVADGALLGRTFRYQSQAAPEGLALARYEPHALKVEPIFEQTLQLHAVGLIVDLRERAKWDLLLSEVEVLPAQSFGENVCGIALVEEEDLPVGTARKFAAIAPSATLFPLPVGP